MFGRMWMAALSVALVLAQATAPAAAPAQPAPQAAAKAEKPKKPKLICEDEGETGSFITKRVCRTPEQIEAERQASRNTADDTLDRAQLCRGKGC
jgi:invasion protein IalB